MAQTDPLTPTARKAIARSLGKFLPAPTMTVGLVAGVLSEPALGHSLAICQLTPAIIANPPKDLLRLLAPTGHWHHQIWNGDTPTACAWSQEGGQLGEATQQEVSQYFDSPVSAVIHDTLHQIEDDFPGETATVRLVVAPAYLTQALAVIVKKTVTIYPVMLAPSSKLKIGKTYPFAEFIAALGTQKIAGVMG